MARRTISGPSDHVRPMVRADVTIRTGRGGWQTSAMRSTFLPFSPPSLGDDGDRRGRRHLALGLDHDRSEDEALRGAVRRACRQPRPRSPSSRAPTRCRSRSRRSGSGRRRGVHDDDDVLLDRPRHRAPRRDARARRHRARHAQHRPDSAARGDRRNRPTPGNSARARSCPSTTAGTPARWTRSTPSPRSTGWRSSRTPPTRCRPRFGDRTIGDPLAPDGVVRATAFSFYATKNMTTGEGGMLTGPADFARRGPAVEPARHEPGRLEALRQGRLVVLRGGSARLQVQHDRHPGRDRPPSARSARRLPDSTPGNRRAVPRGPRRCRGGPAADRVGRGLVGVAPVPDPAPARPAADRPRASSSTSSSGATSVRACTSSRCTPTRTTATATASRPTTSQSRGSEFERLVSLPLHPRLDDGDVDDVVAAVRDIVASAP